MQNMESICEYKGKICSESESILILKTKGSLFEDVQNEVLRLHSYDTPCIIEIEVTKANHKFQDWVISAVITVN